MPERARIKIEDFDADDVRAFYDSQVFRVWHLDGKDRTFRITAVQRITEEFRNETTRKALLWLQDSRGRDVPLPLVLNATNRNTIIQLYGKRAKKDWPGKLITLYPSHTDVAGEQKDCIRIRPEVPRRKAAPPSEPPPSAPALTDHDKATKNEDVKEDDDASDE